MRIAIDLRYASHHFPGIGRFAYSLTRGLLERRGDDRFDVLWEPSAASVFDLAAVRAHPRVRWVETSARPLGIVGALRAGAVLRRLRSDVYFSPFWHEPVGSGVPAVLTLHDVLPLRRPRDYAPGKVLGMHLALRVLASRADWITVTEWSRSEILTCTPIPAERLHVIRAYLPPESSPGGDARPAGVPTGPFALVVGADRPHKNLAVLRTAWRRLIRDGLALPLVWAGPGSDPGRRGMDRGGDSPGVVALGRVSEPQLAWLYSHATLFLLPSTYEGFGVPLLEAMTAGVASVVSDIPALREVGGDAARFVPPSDAEAWVTAVAALMADPRERDRLAMAGRERAREFDPARATDDLRALLGKVAGRGR